VPLSAGALGMSLRSAFADRPLPARVAVAASGGSDSTALLLLMADWAQAGGPAVAAVTVDHGLRAASAGEARTVAALCQRLGVAHATLAWPDRDPRGNLMAAARQARLSLIGAWARGQGIGIVALGHTAEDQAETLVMRLARGSGVDGLSGMARWREAEGVAWVRPLLAAGRADLRAFLTARGLTWLEDPTNADDRFDRVRARRALALLAPLGITRDRLVETAARMAEARGALELAALRAARAAAVVRHDEVTFRRDALVAEPAETRLRLLAHALRWTGGGAYRPRLAALRAAEAEVLAGRRRTLAGCLLRPHGDAITVHREPKAALTARAEPGAPWDGRFRLLPPGGAGEGIEVRALGPSGLAACPDWRGTGLARLTLLASPAAWRGDDLVAAPLGGLGRGWQAVPLRPPERFHSSLLSH
jgi:tRNA(Ile)-lysidine synthase